MIGVKLFVLLGGCLYVADSFSLCPDHSSYTYCVDSCARTCANPKRNKDGPCTLSCTGPGDCACHPGFFKHDDGNCYRYRHCPKHKKSKDRSDKPSPPDDSSSESNEKCGPNEKYGKCKQTCPETCNSKNPKKCDNECKKKGCQCKDGFVKDKYDNCIPKDLCKSKNSCGQNEKLSNDTCVPPPTCQSPSCLDTLPKYCPLYCTNGGCVCKTNYLRDKEGKCVSPDDCVKKSSSSKDEDKNTKSSSSKDEDKSTKSKNNSKKSSKDKNTKSSSSSSCETIECDDSSISSEDKSRCCNDCGSIDCDDSSNSSEDYSRCCEGDCGSIDCDDSSNSSEDQSRCCDSYGDRSRYGYGGRYGCDTNWPFKCNNK